MDNSEKKIIEVCSNEEWWSVMGPASDVDDDKIGQMVSDIHGALMDAGFETVCAKGQRMMLHGWNGANTFRRFGRGLGTFDRISDAEWEAAQSHVDAVISRYEKISAA